MAFDTGSVNFRIFYPRTKLTPELITDFADHAAPPIASLGTAKIMGWVSGRHLFDRDLSEENCITGPYMHVQQMSAERQIPASLLRAHTQMEQDIALRASGKPYLSRAEKSEIKRRVIESLLPTMPPTLHGIPVILVLSEKLIFAGAMTNKQIDAINPAFQQTLGEIPVLATPETIALKRKHIRYQDLDAVNFSPDQTLEAPVECTLGMDFLTWFWYSCEKNSNVYHFPNGGGEFGVGFEGPVTFFREGKGAHLATLRDGQPLSSREAGTALYCGKKIKKIKILISCGQDAYSASVDSEFAFRAIKLPKPEPSTDPAARFEERMRHIETFTSAWMTMYDRFLDLRTDATAWKKTLRAMHKWVADFAPTVSAFDE